MDLLNVVLKNVELKDESHSSYGEDVLNMGKETQAMPEMVSNVALNTERDECSTTRPETEIHKSDVETKQMVFLRPLFPVSTRLHIHMTFFASF